MADKTLNDVAAELQAVNQKLQDAGVTQKGVIAPLEELAQQGKTQIKAAEKAALAESEAAREAARRAGDKPTIEVAVKLEPPEEEGGFLMHILKALGLIGAGAAGLAAGLLVGWLAFVGDLLKRLGKIFKLDKIKIPKFLDDFFKAFTKEGKIAKRIMGIVDDFKMPKFLDDFFKAFTKEGKLGKKIMKIIDNFKMPKFKIFDTIGDFFKSTDKFKDISKAIKGVKDLLPKGGGGGTIGKMFKGLKDVFKPLKTLGTTLGDAFKPLSKLLGTGAKGSGILNSMKAFLKGGMMGKVFKAFARVGKAIAAPLTIIMGIVDGFFEAKDAVGKSEGMMATMVNAVVGAIGGFIDGAIFQLLDLLKSGISWIAGFFGFTEVEKFLDSFSFSKMFNEFLDDVYKWFNQLFSDPIGALTKLVSKYFGANLAIADFIVDMLKKPIVWLLGVFGWDDAAAATESFSLSGTVMAAWDKVVAWVKGLFAWGKDAGATEEGGWSFLTFVESAWTKVKEWFASLLSWGKETEAGSWIVTTIDSVVTTVKGWFTGLFSWASTEDEKDSWIVKTIKGIVTTVKEWFGSMFQFDSASGLLKTVMNIMMWIPNLFVKAVAGIASWFAGILGFEKESEAIASAGKEFNFGDLIMKAVKAIGKWFGDLFDSIINFDFAGIARGLMPDFLADMIFGDEKPKGKKTGEIEKANKAKTELDKEGTGDLAGGGIGDMFSLGNLMKPIRDKVTTLLDPATAPWGLGKFTGFLQEKLLAMLPTAEGLAEGGLVGMSKMGPQSMGAAMGLESGGLFTLSQGEFVLDNQAAQSFLQAAMILKGQDLSSGQSLMDLERDKQRTGGSSSTVVVNNTTSNQVNSSQPVVLPVSGVSPASPETRMS